MIHSIGLLVAALPGQKSENDLPSIIMAPATLKHFRQSCGFGVKWAESIIATELRKQQAGFASSASLSSEAGVSGGSLQVNKLRAVVKEPTRNVDQ